MAKITETRSIRKNAGDKPQPVTVTVDFEGVPMARIYKWAFATVWIETQAKLRASEEGIPSALTIRAREIGEKDARSPVEKLATKAAKLSEAERAALLEILSQQ